jgi:hypothetical protein
MLIDTHLGSSKALDAAFAPALAHWRRLAEPRRYRALLALAGGVALAFTAILVLMLVKMPNDDDRTLAVALVGGMLPPFYMGVYIIVLMHRSVTRSRGDL